MPIMGRLLDFQQIQKHPHLSPLMGHGDNTILSFMNNLDVRCSWQDAGWGWEALHPQKEERAIRAGGVLTPPDSLSQQVKESRHLGNCCKMVLFFCKNPFICNEQIVKEYVIGVTSKRQLSGWVVGGCIVPLRCGPVPSDVLFLLQDTGHLAPLQFCGSSIISIWPTSAGTRKVAFTS